MELKPNEEYLRHIIALFADRQTQSEYEDSDYIAHLREVQNSTASDAERAFVAKLTTSIGSGCYFSDNPAVRDVLVPVASRHLKATFESVRGIPVGLLPSRSFNGLAICAPGGEAILLDSSILSHCTFLFSSYFGMLSSDEDERERSAKAIFMLTNYALSRDRIWLKEAIELITDKYETQVQYCTFRVLLFMLLHEYAHFVKGHFKRSDTSTFSFGPGIEVETFNRDQRDELDADGAAAEWIISLDETEPARESALVALGVAMRYLEMSERLKTVKAETHPPAAERWKAIAATIANYDSAVVNTVDMVFGALLDRSSEA